MIIYMIRHGQTTGDLEDRYGGDYEDHLSDEGNRQAKHLAKKIKDYGIQAIYHSPRIRARETSKILAEKIKVPLIEVKEFRERNAYGVLTGMKKSDAKSKFPEEVEKLAKSKTYHTVTGSEDYDSFRRRVIHAITEISNDKKHERLAVVTHGGPISCIIREVLKLGEAKTMADCSIMTLESKNNNLKLVKLEGITLE